MLSKQQKGPDSSYPVLLPRLGSFTAQSRSVISVDRLDTLCATSPQPASRSCICMRRQLNAGRSRQASRQQQTRQTWKEAENSTFGLPTFVAAFPGSIECTTAGCFAFFSSRASWKVHMLRANLLCEYDWCPTLPYSRSAFKLCQSMASANEMDDTLMIRSLQDMGRGGR